MRNYPEWMAIFIAVTSIGAVIVPVNSWGKPEDIAYTVEDAGRAWCFVISSASTGVAELLREQGVKAIVVRPTKSEDPDGLAPFVADYLGKAPTPVSIGPEELAMIMYTSGTSGKPKGRPPPTGLFARRCATWNVRPSPRPCATATRSAPCWKKASSPPRCWRCRCSMSAAAAQFLANLRGGRRIVMMYKWDVDRALEYIEKERVTTIAAARR